MSSLDYNLSLTPQESTWRSTTAHIQHVHHLLLPSSHRKLLKTDSVHLLFLFSICHVIYWHLSARSFDSFCSFLPMKILGNTSYGILSAFQMCNLCDVYQSCIKKIICLWFYVLVLGTEYERVFNVHWWMSVLCAV